MADISQIKLTPNGDAYDIKDATARRLATTSQTGQVKPDGTTVTIDNDGTIHSVGGGGGGGADVPLSVVNGKICITYTEEEE